MFKLSYVQETSTTEDSAFIYKRGVFTRVDYSQKSWDASQAQLYLNDLVFPLVRWPEGEETYPNLVSKKMVSK